MTVPRLLASLGGLLTTALGALAGTPWWVAATLLFAGLLILRAEALVNARNEARRGLHEHRLLGEVPRRQALAYLREIRRDGYISAAQPDPATESAAGGGPA